MATILFTASFLFAQQQKIVVKADNEPLNRVLNSIRDQYNIHFSYDDKLLSSYKISLNQSFASTEQAISALLKPFPLTYDFEENVYVIFKKSNNKKQSRKKHFLKGYLLDSKTGEPLA